jgi:hypothetical protein
VLTHDPHRQSALLRGSWILSREVQASLWAVALDLALVASVSVVASASVGSGEA